MMQMDDRHCKFNNVYIKNFGEELDDENLRELFGDFGDIISAKVMCDGHNKSKGFGFVSFTRPEAAEKAVKAMHNSKINGRILYCGPAMKKEERQNNLFVKNLEASVDEEELVCRFSRFGTITSAKVVRKNDISKQFGFVCFESHEEASKAQQFMNGRIFGTKPMYVAFHQCREDRDAYLKQERQKAQMNTCEGFFRPSTPQSPRIRPFFPMAGNPRPLRPPSQWHRAGQSQQYPATASKQPINPWTRGIISNSRRPTTSEDQKVPQRVLSACSSKQQEKHLKEAPVTGITQKDPPELRRPVMRDNFQLITLDETDARFKEISVDFKRARMEVTKVELLSYYKLYERYIMNRKWILQDRNKTDPDFQLNERYLYHGTSVSKDIMIEEGLDKRMSKQGCFGHGIYFSDYPRKCVKYARKGDANQSYILLVRVILGDSKIFPKGMKDRSIPMIGPKKDEPYKGDKFYDSVEGCPTNHKEFVVYNSERTIVEGFITFCPLTKPQAVKPEVTEVAHETSSDDSSVDSDLSDDDAQDDCSSSSSKDEEEAEDLDPVEDEEIHV